MTASTKTTLLCILDGLGINPNPIGNAVALAKKPVIDQLLARHPNATLTTFGERVGLPAGQMGNSEVGHLNIGAGRVVEQWLLRISRALAGPFVRESAAYRDFIAASRGSPTLNVIGLLSTGGVHSHSEHLALLLPLLASALPDTQIALHLISDGRDVAPTAFQHDLAALRAVTDRIPKCSIRSICGRFYAMDRDKRWERVQSAYNAIACGVGHPIQKPESYIQESYAKGVTDEFIEPAVIDSRGVGVNDAYVFFNFREDRMREIVSALCSDEFKEFERSAPVPAPERVLCFTQYDRSLGLPFLFEQHEITNHLGEVVAKQGIKQLRVAETEKYPHVTYFLNGGIEQAYPGEERQIVPSPRDVKTYDLKPEMSAHGVAELVTNGLHSKKFGLIVVNFANCDMVGHTGVVEAGVKAVETVDQCLGEILAALKDVGGQALIIADHGNAEQMINYEDGTPHTAHTTYPVPVILVDYAANAESAKVALRDGGALCDVAPTLLQLMRISQPSEMTGRSLIG
jgi:2,3-bisphosphoglycerate-independent phosphoglycerate mutase